MRANAAVLFAAALALAAALPAQQPDKPKAKPAAGKAAKAAAPKDDAMTAKDPVIVAIDAFKKAKVSTKPTDWRTRLPAPPTVAFAPNATYRWHLETSVGPLVVQLLPDNAPRHVTSVIYLARCGFYDGLTFPRILKGFMAQGGSPDNTQAGDAGYKLDGEFVKDLKHDRVGTLSAANSGPNTDGSQFFLTFVPTPHLDGKHTVHGHVIDGLPTLSAIEERGVALDEDGKATPQKVTILHTWISVVHASGPATGSSGDQPKR
jgi:peptidyl-prolyl cis-trans isomerase B (cyclophilin B)